MVENPSQVSILIATGQAMNRDLYAQALNRHSNLRVVARAASSSQVRQAIQANEIHVALIGATLDDGPMSGFTALQLIRSSHPHIRSVILYGEDESHLVVPAFRAGARGVFSLSQNGIQKLRKCVIQVHAGQIWADSDELRVLMDAFSQSVSQSWIEMKAMPRLTRREDSIVKLVEEGLTNRQIAHALKLSEHTVRNNLHRIFEKLGVSTRVELALHATHTPRVASSTLPMEQSVERQIKPAKRPPSLIQ